MIYDSLIMRLWYWHCTIIAEITYKTHSSFKTRKQQQICRKKIRTVNIMKKQYLPVVT